MAFEPCPSCRLLPTEHETATGMFFGKRNEKEDWCIAPLWKCLRLALLFSFCIEMRKINYSPSSPPDTCAWCPRTSSRRSSGQSIHGGACLPKGPDRRITATLARRRASRSTTALTKCWIPRLACGDLLVGGEICPATFPRYAVFGLHQT